MWRYGAYQFQRLQVQFGDPLMSATTSNPLPSAKVDALIPRCHNPKRVQSDLGSELEQRQPVSLIIPTNQRSDKQATPQEKDKSMHGKRRG